MTVHNINAWCRVCGKGYHVCNSCLSQKTIKPWRTITDSVEHYKIFLVLHDYNISKNKESAREELQNCDLGDLENFRPEIQAAIRDIMTEPEDTQA